MRSVAWWLLLFGIAGAAQAAEPYVGASAGRGEIKGRFSADGAALTIDEQQSAYKVFAGVRAGPLGIEGGYVNFGNPDVTVAGVPVEVELTGIQLYLTLHLAAGPALLFAKGGAINWTADARVNSLSADESGTDAAYGAGVALRLTEHLNARAEYEKFTPGSIDDLHLWSGGIELTF